MADEIWRRTPPLLATYIDDIDICYYRCCLLCCCRGIFSSCPAPFPCLRQLGRTKSPHSRPTPHCHPFPPRVDWSIGFSTQSQRSSARPRRIVLAHRLYHKCLSIVAVVAAVCKRCATCGRNKLLSPRIDFIAMQTNKVAANRTVDRWGCDVRIPFRERMITYRLSTS